METTIEKQKILNKSIVHYTERLDVENVLHLIKEGADVNAMDGDKETLLTIAAKTCRFDYIPSRLEDFLSQVKDDKKLAKILTMKETLEKTGYDFSDGRSGTGMLDAYIINLADYTSESRIELMKMLLENGADINLYGEDGWAVNALYYATDKANIMVVDFLIKNGADANIDYYPDDKHLYETLLDKAYMDLQVWEGNLESMAPNRYLSIDGLDEEMIRQYICDLKKIIELLEHL